MMINAQDIRVGDRVKNADISAINGLPVVDAVFFKTTSGDPWVMVVFAGRTNKKNKVAMFKQHSGLELEDRNA